MEERERLADIANTIRTFIGVLEKRKWFAIGVLLATVGIAFALTMRQVPIYRATATIIIEKRSPTVLNRVQEVIELGSSDYWSIKEYMQTQYEILRSRRIAKRVVDKLTLGLDENFLKVGTSNPPLTPEQTRQKMLQIDPVELLMSKIFVEPRMDSQVVLVSVEDADPYLAQELVNTLISEYKEENLEYRKRVISEALAELRDMLVRLKSQLDEADARVAEFERRHAVSSLENRQTSVADKLRLYNERYISSRIERIDVETSPEREGLKLRLEDVRNLLRISDLSDVPYPRLVESANIISLKHQTVQAETKVKDLSARYGPKHPEMIAAYSQRSLLRRAVKREARLIMEAELAGLTKDLGEQNDKLKKMIQMEDEVRKELERAQEEETALGKLKADYTPLVKKRDDLKALYDDVKTRYSETALSAQVETNNVRIQDFAAQPLKPVRPNRKLNLLVGVIVGLLLGVGAAFFVESLDSTIKTREDIEAIKGLEFLGLVPAININEPIDGQSNEEFSEFFVYRHPKSSITEHFRTAKTNLFFSRPDRRPRVIIVTSPGPKEGKTTVAVNLAAVTAMSGTRTLIVDTDMRRPRVHKVLGQPRRPGITEFFLGSLPLENYIRKTPVEGLDVLTCGSLSPNPVEILESRQFKDSILEQLGRYDLILFDSPPLLAVADAKIVCTMVDAVVLVCRAGQTTKDALREAREMLHPAVTDDIGVVLNCFDVEKHSYRYYYYRSKRYGYYNYYTYDDKGTEEQTLSSAKSGSDRSNLWGRRSG